MLAQTRAHYGQRRDGDGHIQSGCFYIGWVEGHCAFNIAEQAEIRIEAEVIHFPLDYGVRRIGGVASGLNTGHVDDARNFGCVLRDT